MFHNLPRPTNRSGTTWLPAVFTTMVWAALGLSALAWGLAVWPTDAKPLAASVPMTPAAGTAVVQVADVAKLLGSSSAATSTIEASAPAAQRLSLLGVALADKRNAIALISLEGQAPKPFHVGATVSPGLVLQAVTHTQALLGAALKSPTLSTLEIPKRP
jgi:general secretion pathway protein C